MSSKLPNYLRAHRKQWSLHQREIAFLIGVPSQAAISQHEWLSRQPSVKSLLRYEALFGASGHALFPDLYRSAERDVLRKARRLLRELAEDKSAAAARKKRFLTGVIRRLQKRRL